MTSHDTRPSVTRLRFKSAVAALIAVLIGASVVQAETPLATIRSAASAAAVAERVVVEPEGLLFPMESTPRCEVLNNFGGTSKTFGSGGHQGVDIGANVGQEVYAVEDGVLYAQDTDLSSGPGLGWRLHAVTNTRYRYFHLDSFAEGLAVGDEVKRGQVIGYVGDTGNATPGGWHLHFEVRPGPDWRTPVDPVPLLGIPENCNIY
ncbi:MAG TPA: M23 family metallopeptidase [Ilumatobacter sp.]|nr:M23 family metallopeptidase [Ilumatobacter sp.]